MQVSDSRLGAVTVLLPNSNPLSLPAVPIPYASFLGSSPHRKPLEAQKVQNTGAEKVIGSSRAVPPDARMVVL